MFRRIAKVPRRKSWVLPCRLKTSSTSMKRRRKGMLSESFWSRIAKFDVSLTRDDRDVIDIVGAETLEPASDRSVSGRRLIILEKPSKRVSGTEIIAEPTALKGFIREDAPFFLSHFSD
ncbi:unnamed protein product [Rodentolepis nana]|uniref:DUF2281 domain-containing protein n=1 Tax=Rodentolepis nana TaxID=102285 RepID=A0A0R3TEG9_RODNA|nr:unnamed protein product [Rodentolepis nana]